MKTLRKDSLYGVGALLVPWAILCAVQLGRVWSGVREGWMPPVMLQFFWRVFAPFTFVVAVTVGLTAGACFWFVRKVFYGRRTGRPAN